MLAQAQTFFGLTPTAAIIVAVAVLICVIFAIVAMTHSGGSTHIEEEEEG